MERVALVTGAGSGIGRTSSRALLDAGWRVVLAGRRREPLEETAAGDERAAVVPADVTDPESVRALFAGLDRLDVLFNNAGVFGRPAPIDELAVEEWEAVVATNLTGAFLCAREAFRLMKAQEPRGGRIINNGSISAQVPRPNAVGYTATKHAITGLTRQLSLDGREHDIACGQIDIGNAHTEMTARMEEPTFDVRHAADAVLSMAELPLDANVLFMTITATKMPFVGRG